MMHDIIIVGGGPAGLTAAVYALRGGKTALVITDGENHTNFYSVPEIKKYLASL